MTDTHISKNESNENSIIYTPTLSIGDEIVSTHSGTKGIIQKIDYENGIYKISDNTGISFNVANLYESAETKRKQAIKHKLTIIEVALNNTNYGVPHKQFLLMQDDAKAALSEAFNLIK